MNKEIRYTHLSAGCEFARRLATGELSETARYEGGVHPNALFDTPEAVHSWARRERLGTVAVARVEVVSQSTLGIHIRYEDLV